MNKDQTKWRSDIGVLLLVGLGVTLLHVLTNGQYGFHRDELDIIMNARRLDWGYVAYPPLTPLLARIELVLFGSALTGMRLLPALAQGIMVALGIAIGAGFVFRGALPGGFGDGRGLLCDSFPGTGRHLLEYLRPDDPDQHRCGGIGQGILSARRVRGCSRDGEEAVWP